MKSHYIARGVALCATIAVFTGSAAIAGTPRAACSLLSAAEVQNVVGWPVTVFLSNPPTGKGGYTLTTCAYATAGHQRVAYVSINQGDPAALATLKQRIDARGRYRGSLGLQGDMLVSAVVHVGKEFDRTRGNKLLAAALKKL
jgi:hypothetical protein